MGNLDSKEQLIREPLHFMQEVVIGGLPYIFEGNIPEEPDNAQVMATILQPQKA